MELFLLLPEFLPGLIDGERHFFRHGMMQLLLNTLHSLDEPVIQEQLKLGANIHCLFLFVAMTLEVVCIIVEM